MFTQRPEAVEPGGELVCVFFVPGGAFGSLRGAVCGVYAASYFCVTSNAVRYRPLSLGGKSAARHFRCVEHAQSPRDVDVDQRVAAGDRKHRMETRQEVQPAREGPILLPPTTSPAAKRSSLRASTPVGLRPAAACHVRNDNIRNDAARRRLLRLEAALVHHPRWRGAVGGSRRATRRCIPFR